MNENSNLLESEQYKEALLKYAEAYNFKKKKTKGEQQLLDGKKYYVIYARKSTEDDKRQVQSIEDQIEQCMKFAKANDLQIVAEPIKEEKSAKIAGKREKFTEMLKRLEKGDLYNSILAWHPDRLARNMKESGEILDLLDNDIIVDLKFPSYTFNNDAAGKMTLSILFAMAKEFSDKLSEDTKRGIRKKVRDGKYVGTSKKGYFNNENGYFRKDDEKFQIYSQAWEMYKEKKTQSEIIDFLNANGEEMNTNSMSLYFQDPFSAGIYCYGDQVVDIRNVDPKFQAVVTPKDFISVQKIIGSNQRGWRNTDEFRPFNEFVICADCGNPMTSGLSTGKAGMRYLNITCGNRRCKEKRRELKLKPIANTIRGEAIVELAINTIDNLLKITEETYEKAKHNYFEERNEVIKSVNQQLRTLRIKYTKLDTKSKQISDKFTEKHSDDINKRLSDDLSIVLSEMRTLESNINKLEKQAKDIEFELESEFPDYETFLNFFNDITSTLKTTEDAYLADQLVKLVFMNTKVKDKNIVGYTLQESFSAYEGLNSQMG